MRLIWSLHAELADLYLEVNGNAGAFEAKAALPEGTVTQSHLQAPKSLQTSSTSSTASTKGLCACAQPSGLRLGVWACCYAPNDRQKAVCVPKLTVHHHGPIEKMCRSSGKAARHK